MARPSRNNVDYFPFYCEEGKKMFYLEETYGNDGFATFVKLLRELAKTNFHYLDLSKNTTMMFLSAKCKVSKDTLYAIINDLVDLGKFDQLLWAENKIIWCQDFINSIEDAYRSRKNKCITYNGLLVHLISLGVRKPIKCTSKGVENPQSKVEESKVEERRDDVFIAIDELIKNYLKDEQLVFAMIRNKENKLKDFNHLKDRLLEFKAILTEKGRHSETWKEFTTYFRNWNKCARKGTQPEEVTKQTRKVKLV